MRNITDGYLDFFHLHSIQRDISKTGCFRFQVDYTAFDTSCLYSVIREKLHMQVSHISHFTPLSKNYNVQ